LGTRCWRLTGGIGPPPSPQTIEYYIKEVERIVGILVAMLQRAQS
jgi:hypothetical protein